MCTQQALQMDNHWYGAVQIQGVELPVFQAEFRFRFEFGVNKGASETQSLLRWSQTAVPQEQGDADCSAKRCHQASGPNVLSAPASARNFPK